MVAMRVYRFTYATGAPLYTIHTDYVNALNDAHAMQEATEMIRKYWGANATVLSIEWFLADGKVEFNKGE